VQRSPAGTSPASEETNLAAQRLSSARSSSSDKRVRLRFASSVFACQYLALMATRLSDAHRRYDVAMRRVDSFSLDRRLEVGREDWSAFETRNRRRMAPRRRAEALWVRSRLR
jgi:hypothetical protein